MRLITFLMIFVGIANAIAEEPIVTVTTGSDGNRVTTSTVTDEQGSRTTTTIENAQGKLLKQIEASGLARLYAYDESKRIVRLDLVRGAPTEVESALIAYGDDGSIVLVRLPDGSVIKCAGKGVRWESGYWVNLPDGRPAY